MASLKRAFLNWISLYPPFIGGGPAGERGEPTFHTEVLNPDGEVAARIEKLLYVKKKPPKPL